MSTHFNSTTQFRRLRRLAHWLACSLAIAMPASAKIIAQDGPSISAEPGSVVVIGNQSFPIEKFRCKTCGLIHSLPTSDTQPATVAAGPISEKEVQREASSTGALPPGQSVAAPRSASATASSLPTDPANRFGSRLIATPADRTTGNAAADAQVTASPALIAPTPSAPTELPARRSPAIVQTKNPDDPLKVPQAAPRVMQTVPPPPSIYPNLPPQFVPGVGPTTHVPVYVPVPSQPAHPFTGGAEAQVESALSSSIGKRLLQLIEENAQLKARTGAQTEVMNAQLSAVNQRAAELQMRLAQRESEQPRRERPEQAPRVEEPSRPQRPDSQRRNEADDVDSGDRLIAREIAELRETIAKASQQDREALERLVNQLRQTSSRGDRQLGAGPDVPRPGFRGPGFRGSGFRGPGVPGSGIREPGSELGPGPGMPPQPNRPQGRFPMNREQGMPGPQSRPQEDRRPDDRGPDDRQAPRDRQPDGPPQADRRPDERRPQEPRPDERRPEENRQRDTNPDTRRSPEAELNEQPGREQAQRQRADAERWRAEAQRQQVVAARELASQERRRLEELKAKAGEQAARDRDESQQARGQEKMVDALQAKLQALNNVNVELKQQLESRLAELAKAKVQLAGALSKLKASEDRPGKPSKKNGELENRKQRDNESGDEASEKEDVRKEKLREGGKPTPKVDL